MQRQFNVTFPNGVPVVFESRTDGAILGSATVVAQTPFHSQYPPGNGMIEIDFDRDLPDFPANVVFWPAAARERGAGTLLERNTVQDQVFARGITLFGLMNSALRGNYVRDSQQAAIPATQRIDPVDWMSPPLENFDISNNVIDGAIRWGFGLMEKLAGIQIIAQKLRFDPMPGSQHHRDIRILNNFVGEAARSGIRVQNVTGGGVSGNLLLNPNREPPIDGYRQDTFEPYRTEFRQPIVISSSQGVTTANNLVEAGAVRIHVSDASYRRLAAYARGSRVLLNGTGLGGLSSLVVRLTDADGASHPVAVVSVQPNALLVDLPAAAGLGGAAIAASSGNAVFRGTLFLDPLDNLPAVPQCTYSVTPSAFNAPAGGAAGLSALVVTQEGCPYTASASGGFVSLASPASGEATGTLKLNVAANSGAARTAAINVANSTITITQAAAANPGAPRISRAGMTQQGFSKPAISAVSPGAILSLYGGPFAAPGAAPVLAGSGASVPAELAGVGVYFGGTAAALFAVAPESVTVQAPNIRPGSVNIQVSRDCGEGGELRSNVREAVSPAATPEMLYLKYVDGNKDPVAAYDSITFEWIGAPGLLAGAGTRPAKGGDYLTLYALGLGETNPAVAPGAVTPGLAGVAGKVEVKIGNVTLSGDQVLYAGLSPTWTGLYQVNLVLPQTVPDGDQPQSVAIGGFSSPPGRYITVKQQQ